MLSRSWILLNMNYHSENIILLHIRIIKGRRNSDGNHTHAEERCRCACHESVWRSWGILQSALSRQHTEVASTTFRPLYPPQKAKWIKSWVILVFRKPRERELTWMKHLSQWPTWCTNFLIHLLQSSFFYILNTFITILFFFLFFKYIY